MRSVETLERDKAALEAEIEYAKAAEKFRKKKADGKATQKDRQEIHELRKQWRLNHRVARGAVAEPATIEAGASVGGAS